MPKKLTREVFIDRSEIIHQYQYDYSLVNFFNTKTNVLIICKKHGEFYQQPSNHLAGKGCFKCYGTKALDTSIFIERSNKIHNYKYDYSQTLYINAKIKVLIICNTHGIFSQNPNSHLQSDGCKKCAMQLLANNKKLSNIDFIERANKIHNYRYNYDSVEYIESHSSVQVFCFNHGLFNQLPNTHLNGSGCPLCGIESRARLRSSSVNFFIEKSNIVHNNKFNYSLVEYKNAITYIKIICPNHGIFEQTPANHLNGKGCYKCSNSNISKLEIKWLDHLNIEEKYRHQTIIILNRKYKVDAYIPETNTIYEFYGDFWHGNPAMYNENEVNPRSNISYGILYNKTIERENLFKEAKYHVCSIWESDFK